MEADLTTLPQDLRDKLIEVLSDEFPAQVYITVVERPGATVAQIATRIDEPPRRVRHQMSRLLQAGLVVLDEKVPRRHARERHYRAIAMAKVVDQLDDEWTDERRRKVARSVARLIMADIGRAVRKRTFGARPGHAQIRVPGEVDEQGWEDLSARMVRTMEEIETVLCASAARLERCGRPGFEVVSGLLLFEGASWDPPGLDRSGPRQSLWLVRDRSEINDLTRAPDLRKQLSETLGDHHRARVFIAVSEKPGATIAEVARRLDLPSRQVRRQVDCLLEAGLLVVEAVTAKRNARERHYRSTVMPLIVDDDDDWNDEERRKVANSMVSLILADVGRAVRSQTFGTHAGHAEIQLPGEVDERGWKELAALKVRVLGEIEDLMIESAGRLDRAGRAGTEVVATLLLFEGSPWELGDEDRDGPRPSPWLAGERARLL